MAQPRDWSLRLFCLAIEVLCWLRVQAGGRVGYVMMSFWCLTGGESTNRELCRCGRIGAANTGD